MAELQTREKIVQAACSLLETQGYHATAMSQIVKESGAPRGSMYYYFPDGKEELAEAAVLESGRTFSALIREYFPKELPLSKAVGAFVRGVAQGVESSEYSAGGPLTAVAMETATTNERLNLACREAFAQIQAAFAEKFTEAGLSSEESDHLAVMVTSAIEGGIILSRTQHSSQPLHLVADYLTLMIEEIVHD